MKAGQRVALNTQGRATFPRLAANGRDRGTVRRVLGKDSRGHWLVSIRRDHMRCAETWSSYFWRRASR